MGDRSVGSGDRVILHVDMDAFFASVEVLDDPSLLGKPVIVGGSGARGVVAACTYEARMFGVRSAMPSTVARRLCPSAVFIDGRYHRYVEESGKLHAIFEQVTPLVEGISLDEAFLDVTGAQELLGDGPAIAAAIRTRVAEELRLTCSIGVGRSKLMAKLASKAAKAIPTQSGIEPGLGVVVVPAEEELAFLHPLPIRALWGVGPVTERRLHSLGVRTVGEMAALPPGSLERTLGATVGAHLAGLARAEDPSPVVPVQAVKSIGHEETFTSDLWDIDLLRARLMRMVDASATNLRSSGRAARTVSVKIRLADFTLITRSHSLTGAIDTAPAIGAVACALLESVELVQGVRLLGVSLTGLASPDGGTQLSLGLAEGAGPVEGGPGRSSPGLGSADPVDRAGEEAERLQHSWGSVSSAVDAIRAKYGGSSVGPASLVGPEGVAVRRRGEAQWGPAADSRPDDDDRHSVAL